MQAADPKIVQKMMHMLANTQEVELTCEQVFAIVDQFAELAAHGENVAHLMPLIQHHLDMCSDCHEEYQALKRLEQKVHTLPVEYAYQHSKTDRRAKKPI